MEGKSSTTSKGDTDIKSHGSAKPAYIPGAPYTEDNKLMTFLNTVGGYIVAFGATTALIVLAVVATH